MAALKINNITKQYKTLKALDNVSLLIHEGEFFGLLGPNGAGKTTLISIIAGLNYPDYGSVTIHDYDVLKDYKIARKKLGVVPQELVFDPFFTVLETLQIQSGYFGLKNNNKWIHEIMDNLDLTHKANTNMRALSGGMKRRVLVAQALVHKPSVIVLDEPTAGVDVKLRKTLWQFICRLNKEGHTIVLTTHYLDEAQILCNRIGMLKLGKIVALDSTNALIKRITGSQLILQVNKKKLLPKSLYTYIINLETLTHYSKYTLRIKHYHEIEFILTALRNESITIEDIQLQQPDLEDVFIQIMGGGTQ